MIFVLEAKNYKDGDGPILYCNCVHSVQHPTCSQ